MTQHHDRVVGDALRRLDVPDHHPDFWAAVDLALRAENSPERAGSEESGSDATVLHLREPVERGLAETRRAPMVALAAAVAVVVALVVGAAVLTGGGAGETTLNIADEPAEGPAVQPSETSVPGDGADTTMPQATSSPDEPAAMAAEEAQARASEWLDRLLAGDMEVAYRLLDDPSRDAMTFDEFQPGAAGLVEGAAAFAADGVERSVLQVETATGVVSVVTFTGDVEREGTVETASYPVAVTPTGVHFTVEGPQLELALDEADASGVTLTSPLVMRVGENDGAWVWFDGHVMEPLAGQGRVEIDVEAVAGPGTHVVTLLAVHHGLITVRAHTVVVP
jgi:hypothetical protein